MASKESNRESNRAGSRQNGAEVSLRKWNLRIIARCFMITTKETADNPTPSPADRIELQIGGMHCAACAATIERACRQLPGVADVSVNFAMGSGEVTTRADGPQAEDLQKLVTSQGYTAKVISGAAAEDKTIAGALQEDSTEREVQKWWWRFVVATAGSVLLVILHFLPHSFGATALGLVIATAVQGYVGTSFVWSALKQLRHRIVSMDALVGLATTAAYLAGVGSLFAKHASHSMELMDGAMILAFISLGKYLELRARARASRVKRSTKAGSAT